MTDLIIQPGEKPRDHLIRVRKYVRETAIALPESDERRKAYLDGICAADAHVVDAVEAAMASLLGLIDTFAGVVQARDQPQGDALDKVIPADPAGRAAVARMVADLLANAPQPAAPAVKAPALRLRPNLPARRSENAGQRGSRQTEDRAAQPAAPAPRAPLARGPGARPVGNATAEPARQPAGAPTAGRPTTPGTLGSLKKVSSQSERAEGPIEAPAQPQRSGYKMHKDSTVKTERIMHMASGKIVNKTTKTTFRVPPMEPGDELIPW